MRALLQQALDALTMPCPRWNPVQSKIVNEAIEALQAELAKPQGEPVAYVTGLYGGRFTFEPVDRTVVLPTGMALFSSEQLNQYGQACYEEGRDANPMTEVADRFAHKLALDLECVLADYSGTWYDTAMKTLGEYRSAMNAIHERECPTFMGEPVEDKP